MKIKINDNVKFLEDSILINNKILVFSDLHLGYENINLDGLFPIVQLKEIKEKLDRIFNNIKERKIILEKIIILGDLKHDFGKIYESEWREVLELFDYLYNKLGQIEIIVIKGNHDKILEPILKKRNIKMLDYYIFENIGFLHGDKLIKNCIINSKLLFLGHLHPSITLSDDYKKERYKCFLLGIWNKKEVYILPSFSSISFGYNLNEIINEENYKKERKKDQFFIIDDKGLKDFEVVIYNSKDYKEYDFGRLKNIT